jgi:hypothetical protein
VENVGFPGRKRPARGCVPKNSQAGEPGSLLGSETEPDAGHYRRPFCGSAIGERPEASPSNLFSDLLGNDECELFCFALRTFSSECSLAIGSLTPAFQLTPPPHEEIDNQHNEQYSANPAPDHRAAVVVSAASAK